MRALLRKEWRTSRAVFLTAVIAVAMLGTPAAAGWRPLSTWLLLLVPVLAMSAIAASRFSVEASGGTLPFLLSMPPGRGRVWASKVAVGLAEFVALAGLMSIVLWVVQVRSYPQRLDWVPFWMESVPSPMPLRDCMALVLPWTLLLFCSALLCSVLIDAPVTASMAGYCSFMGIIYLPLRLTAAHHYALRDFGRQEGMELFPALFNRICPIAWYLVAISVGLIWASYLAFMHKEVR